ncbi:TPA: glutaredoxin family protein [Candidatus Micrarchaeota archaeon]|nr:glutaredoxin family protein [Candidatus Micrarchaeota archaeon]
MTKKVVVYSSNFCPWCDKVKEFLKENNVEFEERNVQENQEYAKEMQEKTGQLGVPVIDVDGKIIIGFNVPALKEALGLK